MIPQAWKENRPRIMRRIVFFFLILGCGILQVSGVLPDIFGFRLLPLLPLTVTVGMFERETYGLSFGLLAGILWDMNLATADGAYALFFSLAGFTCGLLMTYLMMNNLITAYILTGFWGILYAVFSWLLSVGIHGFSGGWKLLLSFHLPNALLNIIFMPVFYYLVRAIKKHFLNMENEELSF